MSTSNSSPNPPPKIPRIVLYVKDLQSASQDRLLHSVCSALKHNSIVEILRTLGLLAIKQWSCTHFCSKQKIGVEYLLLLSQALQHMHVWKQCAKSTNESAVLKRYLNLETFTFVLRVSLACIDPKGGICSSSSSSANSAWYCYFRMFLKLCHKALSIAWPILYWCTGETCSLSGAAHRLCTSNSKWSMNIIWHKPCRWWTIKNRKIKQPSYSEAARDAAVTSMVHVLGKSELGSDV